MREYIIWFDSLGMEDVKRVGGKNASLGEMISNLSNMGVKVPGGFATTAEAYRHFLDHNHLKERINSLLNSLDVEDVNKLAEAGTTIRNWILETPLPEPLLNAITAGYQTMCGHGEPAVAVRSSAG